jgi:hypothetical protein
MKPARIQWSTTNRDVKEMKMSSFETNPKQIKDILLDVEKGICSFLIFSAAGFGMKTALGNWLFRS